MKTSDLIGPALDWAVATCEGDTSIVQFSPLASSKHYFAPSKKWSQGGPIIDKLEGFQLKVWLESNPSSKCEAHIHNYEGDWVAFGPTPLVAAMRCYCASKIGDVVEVPDELCTEGEK